jgi:hypothetical protein
MSGGVITYRSTGQAAKSNNTAEAETKAIAIAVAMGSALTDLHGEFTHVEHGPVRLMTGSAGAVSAVTRGIDAEARASYKRAQHMAEKAAEQGEVWLDLTPGGENPAGILTKLAGGTLVIFTTRTVSFRGRTRIRMREQGSDEAPRKITRGE